MEPKKDGCGLVELAPEINASYSSRFTRIFYYKVLPTDLYQILHKFLFATTNRYC
jgi:hypothetical protein